MLRQRKRAKVADLENDNKTLTNKRDVDCSYDGKQQYQPKKKVESYVTTVLVLASVLWIYSSIVVASSNTWVAVPFIGFCRWDVAAVFLTAQVTCIYMTWRRSKWIWFTAIILLLLGLPHLPENYRPVIFLRPLATMIEHYHLETISGSEVSTHNTGFSQEDAAALVDMTMKYKDRWTHVDMAQALAYFIFGSSINFDRKRKQIMKYREKGYTLLYGVRPTNEVLQHESSFRLFYQHDMEDIQSILQVELAPKLRQVLANTLGVDNDQVVFGNEIGGGYEKSHLGMAAIGVILPHVLWHWIQNPHIDGVYENRIPKGMIPCENADKVTTLLIPLTAPKGSGLRYWTKEIDGNVVTNEVNYKVGNVYTFAASDTLHAIGPWPYFEWKRSQYRINIQAFGVQCDDLKWYIYH